MERRRLPADLAEGASRSVRARVRRRAPDREGARQLRVRPLSHGARTDLARRLPPAARPALSVPVRARQDGGPRGADLLHQHRLLRHAPPLARRAAAAAPPLDRRRGAQPRGTARLRLHRRLLAGADARVVRRPAAAPDLSRRLPPAAGRAPRPARGTARGDPARAGGAASARERGRRLPPHPAVPRRAGVDRSARRSGRGAGSRPLLPRRRGFGVDRAVPARRGRDARARAPYGRGDGAAALRRVRGAGRALLRAPRPEARGGGVLRPRRGQRACLRGRLPFPVEQRRIVYRPVGALSRASLAALEPALFAAVALILAEHPAEKGLIHAPSYAAGERLVRDLAARAPAHARRLIWVESTEAKARALDAHRASPAATVLVSPSLREGVDLPDDFLRFQIVTKMPFPDLGDPWTAARRERDPRWYALETARALVQAYGRSCRHADDHGVTYVLDAQFERFLTRYRVLLPEWFLDAAEPALRARCSENQAL